MIRRHLCIAVALGAVTALAACGNSTGTQNRRALLAEGLGQIFDPPQRTGIAELRALTAFALENTEGALILVEQPAVESGDFFLAAATNDGVTTYGSDQQASLSLRGPVIVASRGFGRDLMSADVGPLPDLLAAGREGSYTRVMRYLDSLDRTVEMTFTCTLSRDTGGMVEYCGSAALEFVNRYTLTPANEIAVTEQWLGDGNGYLTVRFLRRG